MPKPASSNIIRIDITAVFGLGKPWLWFLQEVKQLLDRDENRKSKQQIGFKNSLIFDTKPTSDGRLLLLF
ncbi:hypothetical protein PIB30_079191 [Stylosanthes scabra]|uniref:Uncharacterized protein n=1 Tax=Stylosanthes scabra TaxID=79078 RepID=A0ABU6TT97_9FABA|nr:hypothetical protein [Stylosanthes scabra]